MTEAELMRALECCADADVARCGLCPLRFLGEDECRRRLSRAALAAIRKPYALDAPTATLQGVRQQDQVGLTYFKGGDLMAKGKICAPHAEMGDGMKSAVCPICGSRFIPTAQWHWKQGRFKFCRYHCYLKRESLAKPKNYHPERRVRQFSLTGEIVATYRNAAEAARAIGYPTSTIRACCNRGQPLGTGYRWEYVGEEDVLDVEGEEKAEGTFETDL